MLGYDAAVAWATAHEDGYTDQKDHDADMNNNVAGRIIGLRARTRYLGVRGGGTAALNYIEREAVALINSGAYKNGI